MPRHHFRKLALAKLIARPYSWLMDATIKTAGVQFLGQAVLLYDTDTNADLGTFPLFPKKPRGKTRPSLRAFLSEKCTALGYTLRTEILR